MSQKILQINGRLVVPAEEFERQNGVDGAQFFAGVPGLLWKIWIINRERGEAGGLYLFTDEQSYQAYVDGPIVAELVKYPLWTDVSVKGFDYLPAQSAVTRAPVGEGLARWNGTPRTFNRMAESAYRAVPAIKPADADRRLKKEPDLLVIDVRDAADIAQTGTVPGAVNISLGALTYKADHEVPEAWRDARLADCSRQIITTCILGPMGALGGKLLKEMGFTSVQILEGGVQAWIDAGLPTQPLSG
ncbi:MAG: YdhR family protein [Chloroflexi bacterium]|nr:YdhR family protein [Chloroflexota bacterium]